MDLPGVATPGAHSPKLSAPLEQGDPMPHGAKGQVAPPHDPPRRTTIARSPKLSTALEQRGPP